MSDLSKPLFSLTIGEFIDLSKKVYLEESKNIINNLQNNSISEKLESDIIFIDEVSQLTNYKKTTIYSKVCRFEMPILSRRKPLTFSRQAIIDWIKSGKPNTIDQEADDYFNSKRRRE